MSSDPRLLVASGSIRHRRAAIVTHREGGGMDVVVSDIGTGRSIKLSSSDGETRTHLITRAQEALAQDCENDDG